MEQLRSEAIGHGHRFVDRLIEDWIAGSNRFERPGERFLGAFAKDELVGVCGLNRDPYVEQDTIGRLRHLYVLAPARRCGVGAALVHWLLDDARGVFDAVRLRTTPEAAAFYLRLGFVPVEDKTASHVMMLR